MKTNTIRTLVFSILGFATLKMTALAQSGNKLEWSTAMKSGGEVGQWVGTVIYAVMAIFIMSAIIMGSLAFKQLAADGNWKDFWSKIAGAVGMFVTPIAVYWAVSI